MYQKVQSRKALRRLAEIVGLGVAHQEAVLHQPLADDVERGVEARIVGAQQADLGQHQARGIEHVAVEHARQPALATSCRAAGSPGAARRRAPAIRAIRRRRRPGVAIRPSRCWAAQHIAAEKVWTSSRSRYSQRPASGVERRAVRLVADDAELAIELDIALPRQALVPEHLRRRHHHRAVGVVLALADGSIADAHRPVAAIARQRVDQRARSCRCPARSETAARSHGPRRASCRPRRCR